MLKKLAILLFVFAFCNSFAQKDSLAKQPHKLRRFYFGVFYTPQSCYRNVHSEKYTSSLLDYGQGGHTEIKYRSDLDKAGFGQSVGFATSIRLYKNLFFGISASYDARKYETLLLDSAYLDYNYDLNHTQSTIANGYHVKYESVYLSLTPFFKYYLPINNKWLISLSFGLMYSRLIHEKISYKMYEMSWRSRNLSPRSVFDEGGGYNLNVNYIYYSGGIGVNYLTKNKNMISLEPNFRYLRTTIENYGVFGPSKKNYYSLGLSLIVQL